MTAKRVGDLYIANVESERRFCGNITESSAMEKKREEVMLWHRRLGHLNFRDIWDGIRNGSTVGVNLDRTLEHDKSECNVCLKGKMTRKPFPQKSQRSVDLLEIIHTDVCGPKRTESLGKARYFVEFIDDHSRWCEVRFIKAKSEVFNATKEYIKLVEKRSEEVNKEMDELLKQLGITRRLTAPYCPEQNGIAERKNRTVVSTARCLLIQSGLPPTFWAEAVNCANSKQKSIQKFKRKNSI